MKISVRDFAGTYFYLKKYSSIVLLQEKQMKDPFVEEVKFNCDVSDAKYWGHFSLCGFLMRFRDLYRSENNLPPWAPINSADISEWIIRKEILWSELESGDFKDLHIDGKTYHPFEISEINEALKGRGLVYGAGYGIYMKPNFFLAELHAHTEKYDYKIYLTKKEHARDLFVSSGMLQGRCIFLRIEPLKTLLWQKYSECMSRQNPCLEYAFSHYGIRPGQDMNDGFERKFEDMAVHYSDVILYHELAEALEDVPEWHDMLVKIGDRNAEFMLRALKDLISDTSEYGPLKNLIDNKNRVGLSLYVALIEGYRKSMYPQIKESFGEFTRSEDWRLIEDARAAGYREFTLIREKILEDYKTGSDREHLSDRIAKLISPSRIFRHL